LKGSRESTSRKSESGKREMLRNAKRRRRKKNAGNTEMTTDELKRCKSAYSPLFSEFVSIIKVREDESGVPIIETKMIDGTKMLFREYELNRYCSKPISRISSTRNCR